MSIVEPQSPPICLRSAHPRRTSDDVIRPQPKTNGVDVNLQLMLALSAHRLSTHEPDLSAMILNGHLDDAVRSGMKVLSDTAQGRSPCIRLCACGQLVGRAMLALGRDADAEEIFRNMLRLYDHVSRESVRVQGALDQGWMYLHTAKFGSAYECFDTVIDHEQVDPELRIEAMAGMSLALFGLGEGSQLLDCHAMLMAACQQHQRLQQQVECLCADLMVQLESRRRQELSDHAFAQSYRDGIGASNEQALMTVLTTLEARSGHQELVVQRLRYLQLLVADSQTTDAMGRFAACLNWLQSRRLAGLEISVRIEFALCMLARGAASVARDVLSSLTINPRQVHHGRYALDLQYCLSKVYLTQGRLQDSLHMYKQHAEQAVYAIKRDLPRVSGSTRASAKKSQPPADANRQRLPVRYRSAYQYLQDHLDDPLLSVREIAAHIGVSERALQMAFRTNIGMTPGELIRQERMRRIRADLQRCGERSSKVNVMSVASRWGVTNRSTLLQAYRQQFQESPSETLYGTESA